MWCYNSNIPLEIAWRFSLHVNTKILTSQKQILIDWNKSLTE